MIRFRILFDGDFSATNGLASEALDSALLVNDYAVFFGVDGEVAAVEGAFAGTLG